MTTIVDLVQDAIRGHADDAGAYPTTVRLSPLVHDAVKESLSDDYGFDSEDIDVDSWHVNGVKIEKDEDLTALEMEP